jgi:N6-L-threonylcarbamoyladenine synthase
MPGAFSPAVRRMAEFSFSGLKSAAVRHLEKHGPGNDVDFCASFQRVVVGTLVDRLFRVAGALGARSVGIVGGVSANRRLRHDAAIRGEHEGLPVFVPPLALSTDNAAMIAAAGLRQLAHRGATPLDFNAQASLPILPV